MNLNNEMPKWNINQPTNTHTTSKYVAKVFLNKFSYMFSMELESKSIPIFIKKTSTKIMDNIHVWFRKHSFCYVDIKDDLILGCFLK